MPEAVLPARIWPDTVAVDAQGALTVDGVSVPDLARRFGTPLYVYDARTIRSALTAYRRALGRYAPTRVGYSVKACGLLGVLALLRGSPMSVASAGELEAVVAAGGDARRAWLHGNAKSEDELARAVALGIGRVAIDGEAEIERLEGVLRGRRQAVWLRLAPDVAADTHAHLATGARDQKFGFGLADGAALSAARRVAFSEALRLVGVHAHVGSQVRDLDAFAATSRALVAFARTLARELGVRVREVCVGGGFPLPQTRDDPVADLAAYARAVATPLRVAADLGPVTIVVEPGRSIVGRAAIGLYSVLERRAAPSGRVFVSVDGGMGDNIRPALYGARYEAVLASRPLAAPDGRVALAGAYCEAGDVLISDLALPRAVPGEVVAVPAVGAYSLAMASNYNHRPRPAVVLVDRGRARLIRRRERTSDLLRLERGALATGARGGRGRRGPRGG